MSEIKRAIAWWSDAITIAIPGWFPITFIDSWFSNRVRSLLNNLDPLKKLTEKYLEFEVFSEGTILRALSKAIDHYWERNEENPERFIEFLLSGNWHEEYAPVEGLTRCPIHATIEGGNTEQWVEAEKAYFGKEWGEEHIADLYEGVQGIPWACMPADNQGKYRKVLEWLDAVAYPRIISGDKSWEEKYRIEKYIVGDSRPAERPSPSPLLLDRRKLPSLSPLKSSSLICLLAPNWKNYYHIKTEMNITCEGPRGGPIPPEQVPTFWWEQIKEELQPPIIKNDATPSSLYRCWLPDKETYRAMGALLPVIDIDIFGENKRIIETWLKDTVRIRLHLSEITLEEWRYILLKQIPSIVDMDKLETDESYRDKIKTWYKTCLTSLDEQENISAGTINKVPLLCRKSDIWKLIIDEDRWLADDNQIAHAFKDEIWQITFPNGLHTCAKKYFGIKSLSENVEYKLKPYEQYGDNLRLQQILSDALPFVYTWECYNGKKENDSFKSDLKRLKVITVKKFEAEIILAGIVKIIEQHWGVDGQTLLITQGDGSTESYLAQALAKFLNSKTQPEFYENLIRCKDDNERKAKLISKDVPSDEIDKYLREFQSIEKGYFSDEQTKVITDSIHGPSGTQYSPGGAGPAPPMGKEQETLTTSGGVSVTQHPTLGNLPTGGGTASLQLRTIRLKDPNMAKIVMANTAANGGYAGSLSGGGCSIGGGYDSGELSYEEKLELERLSRAVVKRRLEEDGWEVEQMPFDNPGFDLKANKDERRIYVEIKGHLKKSATAELTARQYREYLQCKTSTENVQWELWNIENLNGDVIDDIRISIYTEIPDDALMAREFNVDLRKCHRSGS